MSDDLGFAPNEDPFVVQHGGFYRRWFSMIDDLDELKAAVATVEGTTQDKWVPVWRPLGRKHEARGDDLEAQGDHDGARAASWSPCWRLSPPSGMNERASSGNWSAYL